MLSVCGSGYKLMRKSPWLPRKSHLVSIRGILKTSQTDWTWLAVVGVWGPIKPPTPSLRSSQTEQEERYKFVALGFRMDKTEEGETSFSLDGNKCCYRESTSKEWKHPSKSHHSFYEDLKEKFFLLFIFCTSRIQTESNSRTVVTAFHASYPQQILRLIYLVGEMLHPCEGFYFRNFPKFTVCSKRINITWRFTNSVVRGITRVNMAWERSLNYSNLRVFHGDLPYFLLSLSGLNNGIQSNWLRASETDGCREAFICIKTTNVSSSPLLPLEASIHI